MKPTIKICGLQGVEVLKSIQSLPIDQIGFVFAPSKRRVTKEIAGEMIAFLNQMREQEDRRTPLTVGVFMNPTQEELTQVMEHASLDVIQLHGEESPDLCKWVKQKFGVQVYKVISIKGEHAELSVDAPLSKSFLARLVSYVGVIDALLLDTHDPVYGGGSGQVFRWELIPRFTEWAKHAGVKLIVAGGLHPDNVRILVDAYEIDGVDVSSGVETDGRKDIEKIKKFVERLKTND
ncbi:phosphoribosylanthranilate isomerase [Paenibacillus sp. N1-5-1-14]|uniref:phosphoribosylanthranilate isomerase n=1 Tax=Paenibacillus radicibacter TaxID=2972488 RepID=UPI002159B52C|nr:phosphoribosylanthranilate isomerase [Paenibacillus radicibacter]MCR8642281.1 phosphoribosylanthranilate isomerase [Paenibacillus radicibacter]